jgi:pimeloyl-ACP methyl ester carboxylesterase
LNKDTGVVLIGHSLGGFIAMILAAKFAETLNVKGVSVLGAIPSLEPPRYVANALDTDLENDRIDLKLTREMMRAGFGNPSAQELGAIRDLQHCWESGELTLWTHKSLP